MQPISGSGKLGDESPMEASTIAPGGTIPVSARIFRTLRKVVMFESLPKMVVKIW